MTREYISKRLRFAVFNRDGFACRYCGATPPEATLHCDHVYPVSRGGSSTIENLVTACAGCNLGKSATPLRMAPKAGLVSRTETEEPESIPYGQRSMRAAKGLTAVEIRNLSKPGMYADGTVTGLYFQIATTGSRSFVFRYKIAGKSKKMGLGPFPEVTLEAARKKAAKLRVERISGADPLEARRQAKQEAAATQAKAVTFEAFVEEHIAAWEVAWTNGKHRQQWRNTLRAYVFPVIGRKAVAEVSTDDVLTILRPIWSTKAETASRVRGRIETILDAAKAKGFREGDNPARFRGHLEHLLPRQPRKAERRAA